MLVRVTITVDTVLRRVKLSLVGIGAYCFDHEANGHDAAAHTVVSMWDAKVSVDTVNLSQKLRVVI